MKIGSYTQTKRRIVALLVVLYASLGVCVVLAVIWRRDHPISQSLDLAKPTAIKVEANSGANAPTESAQLLDRNSIHVRKTNISVGDTADDVFKTLKPADATKKDVVPDSAHPGSMLVTDHYLVDGQSFSLTMGRNPDSGPYRVIRITAPATEAKPVTEPVAVDTRPDCFETAQDMAFALNPSCQRVGLFSSEGRAALAPCEAAINAAEKLLKESGKCR